ncbi:hypothetical protein [Streptomyces sp. NPDC001530]|uniref:hypothetical protein n=1 Tax=Streptomyces sp. NPDC001530 TaxID=3364582 RepID=UPI00369793D4
MTQEDPAETPSDSPRRAGLRAKARLWWQRQSAGVKGLVFSVIGGITVFAVTEWLGPSLVHLIQSLTGREEHGLIIDYDEPAASSQSGWVFQGKTFADLAPPPARMGDALDRWARKNGGTPVTQTLALNLRAKSDNVVTIERLKVQTVCRRSTVGVHVRGDVYVYMLPQRSARVQADAESPEVVFYDENDNKIDAPQFTVKRSGQPEYFSITVSASSHQCDWSLTVHWNVDGKDHTTRIPDKGQYVLTGTNAATEHRATDGELLAG